MITPVIFHISMANNYVTDAPLWGDSMRLLADGVPRAPEDGWGSTCYGLVNAGHSSDRCTIKFVVPNTAADLKLRLQNLDSGTEVSGTMTTGRTVQ